jgi:hypothetical protein
MLGATQETTLFGGKGMGGGGCSARARGGQSPAPDHTAGDRADPVPAATPSVARFDKVATRGYFRLMKTVAVKELKNRLSSFSWGMANGELALERVVLLERDAAPGGRQDRAR